MLPVFIIKLFDGRRLEAHGIPGSAQVEVTGFVECGYFGAEVQSVSLLLPAYAGSQYKKVACGSPLFLRIAGERIDGKRCRLLCGEAIPDGLYWYSMPVRMCRSPK